jgi:hypothetical protein
MCDLILGLNLHEKLGKPPKFDFRANELIVNTIRESGPLKIQHGEILQQFIDCARAQPEKTAGMSWSDYKDLRRQSSGSM